MKPQILATGLFTASALLYVTLTGAPSPTHAAERSASRQALKPSTASLMETDSRPNREESQTIATHLVRLIDHNRGTPLLDHAVIVTPRDGDPLALSTGSTGLELRKGHYWLEPADGFSFVPSEFEVTEDRDLRLDGRFRYRATGASGIWCGLVEAGKVNPQARSQNEPVDGWSSDAPQWRVRSTSTDEMCLVAEGAKVLPGHPFWAGRVIERDGGHVTYAPKGVAQPSVSAPFDPVSGGSFEFEVEPNTVEGQIVFRSAESPSWSYISLLGRLRSQGDPVGHSMLRPLQGALLQDGECSFAGLPEGEYYVSSALLVDQTLRVSYQRVHVTSSTTYIVQEEAGMGPYPLAVDEGHDGWVLRTLHARGKDLNIQLGVDVQGIDLARVRTIVGLPHDHCNLLVFPPDSKDIDELVHPQVNLAAGESLSVLGG